MPIHINVLIFDYFLDGTEIKETPTEVVADEGENKTTSGQ